VTASNLRSAWERISRIDLAALLLAIAGALAYLFEVQGKISDYLKFCRASRRAISFCTECLRGAGAAALEPTQSAHCRGLFIGSSPFYLLVLLAVRSAGIPIRSSHPIFSMRCPAP